MGCRISTTISFHSLARVAPVRTAPRSYVCLFLCRSAMSAHAADSARDARRSLHAPRPLRIAKTPRGLRPRRRPAVLGEASSSSTRSRRASSRRPTRRAFSRPPLPSASGGTTRARRGWQRRYLRRLRFRQRAQRARNSAAVSSFTRTSRGIVRRKPKRPRRRAVEDPGVVNLGVVVPVVGVVNLGVVHVVPGVVVPVASGDARDGANLDRRLDPALPRPTIRFARIRLRRRTR